MQFWPLAVVVLGSAIIVVGLFVLAIKAYESGIGRQGPRYKWNGRKETTDDPPIDGRP